MDYIFKALVIIGVCMLIGLFLAGGIGCIIGLISEGYLNFKLNR